MTNDGQALRWIVELLHDVGIPFQAVGGLAARGYGSSRPLADLDFYIPTDRLTDVAAAAKAHLVRPPTAHLDDCWDLTYMTLEYAGCRIELGGADGARYYDRRHGRWCDAAIDFSRSHELTILGVQVPTMPIDDLIRYKAALDRDVDRADIAELTTRQNEGGP